MFDKDAVRAVVFDYGNTLIEFSRAQIDACDEAIAATIERRFGPLDREHLRRLRDRNRRAIYEGDPPAYRENDNRAVSGGLVRELYGIEPSEEDIDCIVQARREAFVRATRTDAETLGLLERLRARHAVGLLSNYPDSAAIHASLAALGLKSCFDAVVVSADVGFVKPHPLVFDKLISALGVDPEAILFVGDNWLADVQGAKRAGMQAALVSRWTTVDQVDRRPGDAEADLVLSSALDVAAHL